MATVKISSKNQITVPKSILTALRLKGGKRVILEPRQDGVLIRPIKKSVVDEYYGYGREAWGKLGGGERYLKRERAAWER